MTINVANPLALATLGMADDVASSSSPAGTFSIILSATKVANGAALTVTGGITLSATATGVTVTLKRYRKSDGALLATVVNAAAVDFVGSVQKTWATIAGSAVTITGGTTAQEEYLVAEISGGTPAVTGETSGQVSYAVIPAFSAPGLAIHDGGDGSVTFDVSGNKQTDGTTDQVSRLRYRKASDAAWTYFGTSKTGNSTAQTGPTGLEKGATAEAYTFELVPYDAVTGLEGPSSKPAPVHLEDSSVAASTSDQDDEMALGVAELLSEMGRPLTYNGYGVAPVVTTGIVALDQSQTMEVDGRQEVIKSGSIELPATVATNPDRRDSFTIDGDAYGCEAPPHPADAGWVQFRVRRLVRVRQGAGRD